MSWNSEKYEDHGRFVSNLGSGVVDLLNPQPGERILDLGCGDGALTLSLIQAGAEVVGVDTSDDFLASALAKGIDAREMDGRSLEFDQEFDAVFSNAALHWMTEPEKVVAGVARSLKPGGRFVAEFGGHGNIAAIRTAIRAVLHQKTGNWVNEPKFYPSPGQYSKMLEGHGFAVETISHFPRPVILPTDMKGWLRTFAVNWVQPVYDGDLEELFDEVSTLLAPVLQDSDGKWTADYVRLRFRAVKSGGTQ